MVYVTCLPIIAVASCAFCADDSAARLVCIDVIVCTSLSMAVWFMKLDVSTGLVGSWYCNCATSSFKNACGSSRLLLVLLLLLVADAGGAVDGSIVPTHWSTHH